MIHSLVTCRFSYQHSRIILKSQFKIVLIVISKKHTKLLISSIVSVVQSFLVERHNCGTFKWKKKKVKLPLHQAASCIIALTDLIIKNITCHHPNVKWLLPRWVGGLIVHNLTSNSKEVVFN